MTTDNTDIDELVGYQICANCISELYLSTLVRQTGNQCDCTYCGETGMTIPVDELADRIDTALEDHFQRTSIEPTGYEYALLRDKEISYEWERHGAPVVEIICEIAGIEDNPAQHIRQILEDRYWDFDAAAAGEENPYDIEAHYEEKDVDDYELQAGWAYFQKSLKTETRLFNREAEAILSSIFEDLSNHITQESGPVIVDAGPNCRIAQLYRARVFQSRDKLATALQRPDHEIGPPPFSAATAGRMNAKGISVFYGATEPGVALAEVQPPVGSRVVVARFDIIQPLHLLDVEALRSIYVDGSVFDASYITRLQKAKFLRRLSHQLTMPVMPEDEPADYLVTQAIADYLATRMEPDLDGIIYRSIQDTDGGLNVALFHKSSRVERLDIPEGTTFSTRLEHWTEDAPESNYWIWEEVPDKKNKKAEYDHSSIFGNLTHHSSATNDLDLRTPTLRLDAEAVTVHHIKRIRVETLPFSVTRHRTSQSEGEF